MCLPSILKKITPKKNSLVPSRVISSRFQSILTLSLVIVLSCLLVLTSDIRVNPGLSGCQQHAVNSLDAPVRRTPSFYSVSLHPLLGLPSSLPTIMDIMDEVRGMSVAYDTMLDSLTALLLVVLPMQDIRQNIVNNAKHLRKLLDEYICNNVFITPTIHD